MSRAEVASHEWTDGLPPLLTLRRHGQFAPMLTWLHFSPHVVIIGATAAHPPSAEKQCDQLLCTKQRKQLELSKLRVCVGQPTQYKQQRGTEGQ